MVKSCTIINRPHSLYFNILFCFKFRGITQNFTYIIKGLCLNQELTTNPHFLKPYVGQQSIINQQIRTRLFYEVTLINKKDCPNSFCIYAICVVCDASYQIDRWLSGPLRKYVFGSSIYLILVYTLHIFDESILHYNVGLSWTKRAS